MTDLSTHDLPAYALALATRAREASRKLVRLDGAGRTAILRAFADAIRDRAGDIVLANAIDIDAAEKNDLGAALRERLKLDEKKVRRIADAVDDIAAQVDPVGQTLEGYVRPNGLRIEKRRVPLGVVLFFYESRPNVTADAAALCIKSGNAVILRGGKEALHSNKALADCLGRAMRAAGQQDLADVVQLVANTDRALVPHLLRLDQHIDVVIPRGGESLIRAVVEQSTIPVLKHFNGVCHVYVDSAIRGMEQTIRKVCVNAKTSYPGGAVCNAAEKILVHKDAAPSILPQICGDLAAAGVEIRGDEATRRLYPQAKPAVEQDWREEYLAFVIAVKVVDSLDAAITHINDHGSHHTDAILTTDLAAAARFVNEVDSASVMVNASTRFADGGEYGLGAELGISTDKLHARGPMGAADLCTFKWIVTGDGQCR